MKMITNNEIIKIKKDEFEPASIEVITFDVPDIICTSSFEGDGKDEFSKLTNPLDLLGLYD